MTVLCSCQVKSAVTLLVAAIAQSHTGKDEAFVRVAAKACLQAGLSREGTSYVLKPVRSDVVRGLIHAQKVTVPGKLVQYLGTPAVSQYFKIVRTVPTNILILANLPALITKQHRTAKVQKILSHTVSHTSSEGPHVTTTPQQSQDHLQARTQHAAPPQQQKQALLAARQSTPVQLVAPAQQQTQAQPPAQAQ